MKLEPTPYQGELAVAEPVPVRGAIPCRRSTRQVGEETSETCGGTVPASLNRLVKLCLEREKPVIRCGECGTAHGFGVRGTRLVYGALL